MMCSEREMELSDEHDGIIELPSGEVGQTFTDWLGANDPAKVDPVIEIAITPNRPDALGVRGVARDLAARGLGTMKPRDVTPVPATFAAQLDVTIADDTLDGCPVFCGRLIKGVKNGPSPAVPRLDARPFARHWVASNLVSCGCDELLYLRSQPPAARL